ncbi:unnamed protein product, partial [marine sediment metagenome]
MVSKKLYRDINWMKYHYGDLEESTCKIAKTCDCNPCTVWCWLRKFQIKTRGASEAQCLSSNHVEITKGLTEFLNGLLLGDGCLETSGWTSQYKNSSSKEVYLEWLKGRFGDYKIEQSGHIFERESWHTFPGSGARLLRDITYYYSSRRYVELDSFQKIFYRKLTEVELLEKPWR